MKSDGRNIAGVKRLGSILPHLRAGAVLALHPAAAALGAAHQLRAGFDGLEAALFPDVTLANYIKLFARDAFGLAYQDSLIAAPARPCSACPSPP